MPKGNFEHETFEKTLGCKAAIQDLVKEIQSSDSLNLKVLAEKHGIDTAELGNRLKELLEKPIASHEELSDRFTKLRNDIKIQGISNKKIDNLKKKIKLCFKSLGEEGSSTNKLMGEIQILLDQLEFELKKLIPLHFDDEHDLVMYRFKDDFGEMQDGSRSRTEIAKICADYTEKGKDLNTSLTQEQILDKYRLQAGEWNVIKDKFRLLKKQEIIPPILYARIIKKYGKDYADKFVDQLLSKSLEVNAREGIKARVQKRKDAELAKLIAMMNDGDFQTKNFIQFLKDNPQAWKLEPSVQKKYKNAYDVVAAGDFHFGENTAIVTANFQNMMYESMHMDGKNLYLFFLGDMMENIVPGGFHAGQERNMDLEGFALMKYVADTIANELKELRKKAEKKFGYMQLPGIMIVEVQKKTLDPDRRFASMVYLLIEEKLRNYKNIHIITKVNNHDKNQYYQTVDLPDDQRLRINYHHGDNAFNEKAAKDPMALLGKNYSGEKDNLILSGHWHQINRTQMSLFDTFSQAQEADCKFYKRGKIKQKKAYDNAQESIEELEKKGIKIIRVPSICPPNTYAQQNGYLGDPGFVHITRSRYGGLDVSTRNLGSSLHHSKNLQNQIKKIQKELVCNVDDYRPFHG